jgi:hypothetical protein
LEVDAKDHANSAPAIYAPLKDSNSTRIELTKELLSAQLNLECASENKEDKFTPAYFLGRHEVPNMPAMSFRILLVMFLVIFCALIILHFLMLTCLVSYLFFWQLFHIIFL